MERIDRDRRENASVRHAVCERLARGTEPDTPGFERHSLEAMRSTHLELERRRSGVQREIVVGDREVIDLPAVFVARHRQYAGPSERIARHNETSIGERIGPPPGSAVEEWDTVSRRIVHGSVSTRMASRVVMPAPTAGFFNESGRFVQDWGATCRQPSNTTQAPQD